MPGLGVSGWAVLLVCLWGSEVRPLGQDGRERPGCEPGYYCPEGTQDPVPCPGGTFGSGAGAWSIAGCRICPAHHYCPRPGLSAPRPCGGVARQPREGQEACVCPGEGQTFQVSDGQCPCALGYRPAAAAGPGEGVCVLAAYEVCRDGRWRSQHGACLERSQWEQHCRLQVCGSGEYQGFDRALGLCVCGEAPDRALCVCGEAPDGALCGGRCLGVRGPSALLLECGADGQMRLVWTADQRPQQSVSGRVLERVFRRWDSNSQEAVRCSGRQAWTHPVHSVQTSEAGFLGLLHGLPPELVLMFSSHTQNPHRTTGATSALREEEEEEEEKEEEEEGPTGSNLSTVGGVRESHERGGVWNSTEGGGVGTPSDVSDFRTPSVGGGAWNSSGVGGGAWNSSSIGGGAWNSSSVGGGAWNSSSVGGGAWNSSSVGGGAWNSSSIGGGAWNSSGVGGGAWNSSGVGGGAWNSSSVGGGAWNSSSVGGGAWNSSSVGGGAWNSSSVGGGAWNSSGVGGGAWNSSSVGGGAWNSSGVGGGVLNPTACLQLGDILLFTVSREHYPQYDIENLYNTNSEFDWGAFRHLEAELTLSWTPPTLFPLALTQPGVYALRLSSQQHKHMYVRVMPAGGQCYEAGPFFPTVPRHVTRVGIARQRHLLLRPDWLVTGGLLFGAVVILSLCVTLLILFGEYGWPDKQPIRAQYRALQQAFYMDDYSSRGSRVTTWKKTHRNLQARMTDSSIQPAAALLRSSEEEAEEFWDYEQQVDLEAFSSSTFYRLLLTHSLSVTNTLGSLTGEVKDLYQGVMGRLRGLQPGWSSGGWSSGGVAKPTEGRGFEGLRREVEREAARRQAQAAQVAALLYRQLQVLGAELRSQSHAHRDFAARLRESIRLLGQACSPQPPGGEQHTHLVLQRVWSLASHLAEQVREECQRQGAWALLGDGAGAKLLCPDTGAILTKDDIIAPDGTIRACAPVHSDPTTGLIRPNGHAHMLLGGGQSVAVPPDFLVHPQTGRVMPTAGGVAYDPVSSTLVLTIDSCTGDGRQSDSPLHPLLPFVPYPVSPRSHQPLAPTRLRGLRPGQRPQLGAPMSDPDTGLLVPVLAVTIHPRTGLVYPLGGVCVCPLTRLVQPIQVGAPMLDPRTGGVVLTAGVGLDPVTGAVVPVGGVLLGEPFIEPLSGWLLRVGGASVRAGQPVPRAGGYQALLESQVLLARVRLVDLLRGLTEGWSSGEPRPHAHADPPAPPPGPSDLERLCSAASDLQRAWGASLHGQLQLITRLDMLLDWAQGGARDGGVLGQLPLPGADVCVPALLGQEYPDPLGSGLRVPVLGAQLDPLSGDMVPLAGTMEDPDGKGLVAIRCGAVAVDPVTGGVATVVGARLDLTRQTVVPVTAPYWLALGERPDSVQVEALQREACSRTDQWQRQREKEEELVSDLDAALQLCFSSASQHLAGQWADRERSLREAVAALQESGRADAQRRAGQRAHLDLVLPPHITLILTQGDEAEREQRCVWESELQCVLDHVSVCVEALQQDKERERTQGEERTAGVHHMEWGLRRRELWEQLTSRQADLDSALSVLHCVRMACQLRSDTAQAVLSGRFWYRDYGLALRCTGGPSGPSRARAQVEVVGQVQQKALVLLERLAQLLEDKQTGRSPKACPRRIPDNQPMKAQLQPTHICVPTMSEAEWDKLLGLSPLFQILKGVELQLRGRAREAGLLRGEHCDRPGLGTSFIDALDAQWECEGELIPLDASALNPRERLVYQHGLFLLDTLHTRNLTPAVSLRIASSLPVNNYHNNTFRNSFFYQESEETVFVRRQRLQAAGGFSLLLTHTLSHIAVQDMTTDASPAFQRVFYRALQVSLEELFQARLALSSPAAERSHWESLSCSGPPVEGLQRPSEGLWSQNEVGGAERKRREEEEVGVAERKRREEEEASLLGRAEELLAEPSRAASPSPGHGGC